MPHRAVLTSSYDRKPKVLFVAEQFVPPVYDGSTLVYKLWIDRLAEFCELYAIFFDYAGGDPGEAERYLAARCAAFSIFPAQPRSRLWKVTRSACRRVSGTLFAPRWLEEWGRAKIKLRIGELLARYDPDIVVLSKLSAIHLCGQDNIRHANATVFLDLHDDFVARDRHERAVLARLLARFPELRQNRYFRHMRLRHLLTRIVPERARRQEKTLLGLVDCVLSSSREEHAFYRRALHGIVPCELLNWPTRYRGDTCSGNACAAFGAGFIGGDHPFNVEGILFFCERVLPLIQRDQPDFRFLIAGGVTRPLSLIAPRWQGVSFEGFLPDIRQFYDRIAVAVVPLLCGTGISLKTREALNFGRPVVSTAIGARGLDPLALPGLILAEAPEAFAQAVIKAARMPRNLMETHAPVEMPAFRDALAELMCRHANRATSPETAHGRASRSGERR